MIMMPMRNQDAAYTTAPGTFFYYRVKIGSIVNGWIDQRCALDPTAKNNRIGTRPRHDRGIGSQDNRIELVHYLSPIPYEPCVRVICSGTTQGLAASSGR